MKIDIVDLMDFYCNDAPSPDAPAEMEELMKQRGTWVLKRETHRRRNRPLLAAAVMLLAVLIAMPFALPRITGGPASTSAENAQAAQASGGYQTAHIAGLLLPSAVYPVALEVPAEYVEEIEVDTPFQDILMFESEIQYDNAVFSFCDKSSQAYGRPGLVWCITATPQNEYTPLAPANYDYIYVYNQAELGADEGYVYELIYPRAEYQYNKSDPENAESYFTHIAIGQDLLTQFIQQNSLQSDGSGLERYAAFLALQKERLQ